MRPMIAPDVLKPKEIIIISKRRRAGGRRYVQDATPDMSSA
jgi:hypothetical protein